MREPKVRSCSSQGPSISGTSGRPWVTRKSPTCSSQKHSEQTDIFFSQAKSWCNQLGLGHPVSYLPLRPPSTHLLSTCSGHWGSLGWLPRLFEHQCSSSPRPHGNLGWTTEPYLREGLKRSVWDASSGMDQVPIGNVVWSIPCSARALLSPHLPPSSHIGFFLFPASRPSFLLSSEWSVLPNSSTCRPYSSLRSQPKCLLLHEALPDHSNPCNLHDSVSVSRGI